METISTALSHGGVQGVYKHASTATDTEMTFAVFVPPHADGTRLPVVWYLSGLTCTHANVTEKGEFREVCARLGLVLVAPDTSPRGEAVPDDPTGAYDFGLGAGFYVDATEEPFASNYRMWTYLTAELPALAESSFPVRSNPASNHGAFHGWSWSAHHRAASPGPLSQCLGVLADRGAFPGAMGTKGLRGISRGRSSGVAKA